MKWYKIQVIGLTVVFCSSLLVGQGQAKKRQEEVSQPVTFMTPDVALEPTHLMMVPTSRVLQRNEYVISFHEFSFGIDNNIQIFLSPWDPIPGRVWLGGKFGMRDDLAFALGISDQYWYYNDHDYHYFHAPMLGLYGVKTLLANFGTAVYGMADAQIGDGFSVELGAGVEKTATRQVNLMGELALSSSFENPDHTMNMGFDLNLGLRYMVASLPPLKIDFGINVKNYGLHAWPYIDVSYSSQIR